MTTTLAGILSNAKGGPIDYQGKSVMMSYRIPITREQEVFVEILKYNDKYEQGFKVSIDQSKGLVEVNNQRINAPIFWTKTAPSIFSFKCFPKKNIGVMNIWNVWNNTQYKGNVDAWIGHAGLYIEQEEDGAIAFHCSNGMQQVDFEDLVFRVRVK